MSKQQKHTSYYDDLPTIIEETKGKVKRMEKRQTKQPQPKDPYAVKQRPKNNVLSIKKQITLKNLNTILETLIQAKSIKEGHIDVGSLKLEANQTYYDRERLARLRESISDIDTAISYVRKLQKKASGKNGNGNETTKVN